MPDPSTETVGDDVPWPGPAGPPEPGAVLGGRFELRAVLGRGGSSVVYRALDRTLGHDVAVKLLRPDRSSPLALRRLRREVDVARAAKCARLVPIWEIGESEAGPFLVMELVEGRTLRAAMEGGRLPVDDAIRIASEVLEGLAALHAIGVVHRDVKPGNVLLDPANGARLADLGLARSWDGAGERATATDVAVGTLEYAAPEQVLGEEIGPRADLYGLGVVLYEMLAGAPPWRGGSALGILLGRLQEKPVSLKARNREVPGWLEELVLRLIDRDPDGRPPSAEAVLEDLRARRHRWLPWIRRRRGRLALTAAAAVVALVALRASSRPAFDRLVPDGAGGARAVAASGETLWADARIRSEPIYWAPVRVRKGEPPEVAVVFQGATRGNLAENLVVNLLDPKSGRVRRTVALPDGTRSFPQFSRAWHLMTMDAVDLDGDGVDELLVGLHHREYWPSLLLAWYPAFDRTAVLYRGSGHHRFAGAADFDGDGLRDLLLVGPSNRFGYQAGFAAVRAFRRGEDGAVPVDGSAEAPDLSLAPESGGAGPLLWFALGPLFVATEQPARWGIDERSGHPFVDLSSGRFEIDGDGFALGDRSDRPPAERNAARSRVYARLREANRWAHQGEPKEALATLDGLEEDLAVAGDSRLAAWVGRVRVPVLIAAGRYDEADAAVTLLLDAGAPPFEVHLEAARQYHAAGALDRALASYRAALRRSAEGEAGHARGEGLQGEVFVLAERSAWNEALATIGRFAASWPHEAPGADALRRWVLWRSGTLGREPDRTTDALDAHIYWGLEQRLALGDDPAEVKAALAKASSLLSGLAPMVGSLESELAERLGDPDAALRRAEGAWAEAKSLLPGDLFVRAHLDLLAERLADRLRRAGRSAEADRVRFDARQLLEPRYPERGPRG